MRSGFAHLRKRRAVAAQNNFFVERIAKEAFIESLIEFIESHEPEVIGSDIEQPMWSVVSFARVEAGSLTYSQATQLLNNLDAKRVAGLCIVTDAAASQIRN